MRTKNNKTNKQRTEVYGDYRIWSPLGKNIQKAVQELPKSHLLTTLASNFMRHYKEKNAQKKTTCINSALRKLMV